MAEKPENTLNPGDPSSEIQHVPRMLEVGDQSLRIASTDLEGRQLASTPQLLYILPDVPKDYPPLNFKPISLRTWFLVMTIIFFFVCLGSILAILICDHASQATLHIHAQRGFLALRYLPSIIGTITAMWWRSIAAALFHVTPYISMTDAKAQASISSGQVLSSYQDFLFSTRYSTIRFLVSEKNWLMLSVICLQIMLALFVVPTKNVFVQLLPDDSGWIVAVSRIAAGILITMYSLLIICTVSLVLWFHDRQTGLKWDPVCIADQIALIQGSNIFEIFRGLEFATRKEARDALTKISRGIPRLGYWKFGNSGEIWHGIAFRTDAPETEVGSETAATGASPAPLTPPFSYHQNADTAPQSTRQSNGHESHDLNDDSGVERYSSSEGPLNWEGTLIQDPENYRFRDIEPFHSDTGITCFVLLGILALSALILTIRKGILHQGLYFPASAIISHSLSSSRTTSALEVLLEPALKNFIFAFCPSLVMSFFTLLWIITDNFYRTVQPIAGMYKAAPAHKSILLDYMQCLPIIAIPKAALNKHWRVTWFCLLALSANAGPIAAAGIFVSSPVEGGFLMRVSPLNLWFILSLLVIYLVTLPFVRPQPKHRLPRQNLTIADLICYCYASNLVNDKMFSVQKRDDEKIHLESQVHLGKKSYGFGLYKGTDERRHIGIDIVDPTNPIDTCDPGRSVHVFGRRIWFRKPMLLKRNVA